MKKILIIVLIVLILVLLSMWGFLFLNGRDGVEEITTQFTGGSDVEFSEETNTAVDSGDIVDNTAHYTLTQISQNAVAGANFVTRNSNSAIHYTEKGTGHLFEITLPTYTESQITNTTIPRTTEAVWSKAGTRVAITTEIGGEPEIFLGHIAKNDGGEEFLDGAILQEASGNVMFGSESDILYYTKTENHSTAGYRLDLKTNEQTLVFSVPFADVQVVWGETASSTHYLYTKPSKEVEGFVYALEAGELNYVTNGARGLFLADASGSTVLLSDSAENEMTSRILNRTTGSSTPLGISALPSKCDMGTEITWCAAPFILPAGDIP